MTRRVPPIPDAVREQYRMARLQVFNWGTFSELHEVPVSERGFLIVGRSGAGKSTLLDAFSALLVPPRWVDFNAAAREADRTGRDRSLVSYIRGAWASQSDVQSGEFATRYLRGGTTWSAIALSYRNGHGQHVTLVQLFWLRGAASAAADVRRLYLVFERDFDLREVAEFAHTNFDVRKLKQQFPEAYVRDHFDVYCERFRRLLGIENETALRLLHKTQSAKNLGDLNSFLRDFMLDKPETFEVADRLVNEFGELNAAHQAVVTAREQVETLVPARERHVQMQSKELLRNDLQDLRAGMNGYREQLRIKLLRSHIGQLEVEAEGNASTVERKRAVLDNRGALLRDLEQQRRAAGGEQIEYLENEKQTLVAQRTERMRRRESAVAAARALDWALPGTAAAFAAMAAKAREELNSWKDDGEQHEAMFLLDREKSELVSKRAALEVEIASLLRQPSNIPAHMLALRQSLANATGVPESALPFAGELIEVRPDAAAWRGAIERVLRGLALSLLVSDEHYSALAAHINTINLGQRLVYLRMTGSDAGDARPLRASSLVNKLEVRSGACGAWLTAQLRQHFDYDCVDSIRDFRAAPDRALTVEGQVKHNRTRHEKNDRTPVDARASWVLGFDNRAKLALFQHEASTLAGRIQELELRLKTLRAQIHERGTRAMHCNMLANLQWQEIDALPLADRISAIDAQLKSTRDGNQTLELLDAKIGRQRELVTKAEDELSDAVTDQKTTRKAIDQQAGRLAALEADVSIVTPTPFQQAGLDARYAMLPSPVQLDGVDAADRVVGRALTVEIEQLSGEIAACEKFIEAQYSIFIGKWRGDSDGLDASLRATPDFMAKLDRLETDGLPAHEHRFFDLLQNQSTQNLAALSTHLNNARKTILERMELVNESLGQVAFNVTDGMRTYLHIDATDRQLPDVRKFRQDIQAALSHAFSGDRADAEQRFLALRRLVADLSSQDPEKLRWRTGVLDVRLHVEFVGREIGDDGTEIEVYRSGAGKSGGQRQKLATTCLAAALRYQLGGQDLGVPMYAPVVLDEAFDKADNEFTALAMHIFENFGFQMIVATPLKSVMTLEPFIGGACFVDIRDRRESGVLLIEYDDASQKLSLPAAVREEVLLEAAG